MCKENKSSNTLVRRVITVNKIILSNEDMKKFENLAENGATINFLAEEFNISKETVKRIIKEYDINATRYKEYNRRKNFWTNELIEELTKLYNKKEMTNEQIAGYFNVPLQIVTKKIKALGLTSKRRYFQPTDEQIKVIRKMASEGSTRTEIAAYLKVDRCVLPRLFKEFNIELTKSKLNNQGTKTHWTEKELSDLKRMYLDPNKGLEEISEYFSVSVSTVNKKARKMNLSKVRKNFLTDYDIDYLKNNYKTKTIKQIANETRWTEYGIQIKLYMLNLLDEIPLHPKRQEMPQSEDFMIDYCNPLLSHKYIETKYGLSSVVGKWRRQDFGKDFVQSDISSCETSIELKVSQILNDLDIPFYKQYSIDKYYADFYLGHKIIIECDGLYWHSLDLTVKRDKKRDDFLTKKGYKILRLKEDEIHEEVDFVKEKIKTHFYKNIAVHVGNNMDNNPVNL